nr:branched-chain amino acid ABC transporter substrate-binding protein [Alphaproteobacteria bacterium]
MVSVFSMLREFNLSSSVRSKKRCGSPFAFLVLVALFAAPNAIAQPAQATEPAASAAAKTQSDIQTIPILLVRQKRDRLPPLSLLQQRPDDEGLGGAKLAISDNNTTGRFLKQAFVLDIIESADINALISETSKRVETGTGMIVADVDADVLTKLADALKDKTVAIFNAGAPDDRLRSADCRQNVFHTAPSRAMLADALGQYIAWKRWRKWFLVSGTTKRDVLWAEALKRTAKRFGQKIV